MLMTGPFGLAQVEEPEDTTDEAAAPPPVAEGPDPTNGENFKDFQCQQKADGFVCVPTGTPATVMFMNVQDAINRASIKMGVNTQQPVTGNISVLTGDLAKKVLESSPMTDRVRTWFADPNASNGSALAAGFAEHPMYAIATFDEISGFARPVPLIDPRKFEPAKVTAVTVTPPKVATQVVLPVMKRSFWRPRNIAIIATSIVVVAGVVTYVVVRRRRKSTEAA